MDDRHTLLDLSSHPGLESLRPLMREDISVSSDGSKNIEFLIGSLLAAGPTEVGVSSANLGPIPTKYSLKELCWDFLQAIQL